MEIQRPYFPTPFFHCRGLEAQGMEMSSPAEISEPGVTGCVLAFFALCWLPGARPALHTVSLSDGGRLPPRRGDPERLTQEWAGGERKGATSAANLLCAVSWVLT